MVFSMNRSMVVEGGGVTKERLDLANLDSSGGEVVRNASPLGVASP
jgi:hypothetical protein